MSTKPNAKSFQDMPPSGGYPHINVGKRNLQGRGVRGIYVWGIILGATAFGFFRIGQTNGENRKIRKERRESRMAILPYLEGERQLLYHQQIKDELEHEHAIMKDVEGWKVGERPYSSRWTPPIPRDPSKHK